MGKSHRAGCIGYYPWNCTLAGSSFQKKDADEIKNPILKRSNIADFFLKVLNKIFNAVKKKIIEIKIGKTSANFMLMPNINKKINPCKLLLSLKSFMFRMI